MRHRIFPPGCRVGVAVSGGADSVCLLTILLELASRRDLHLRVLHLDHGLRGAESRADAEFVEGLAARLGIPFELRAVNVAALGGNLEQAAREARRDFYLGAIRDGVVDRVATGHTADDQAETVLFRFLRGAGITGLAGMRALTPEGIARPLLELRRAEIRSWLSARGVEWREDSSNAERRFARNRIRLDLLPALERDWNPSLAGTLVQLSRIARDEEDYWAQAILTLAAEHLRADGSAVLLSAKDLAQLAPAASRRLVRHAIEVVKGDLSGVEFHHVERVLDLARKRGGHGRLLLPGLDVWRSFGTLRFHRADGGAFATPHIVWNEIDTLVSGDCLDADRLIGPLAVRTWQPGDAMMLAGQDKETKIKDLFQRHRVPCWDRGAWPMVTSGGRIVWTRRFGVDAHFLAGPGSAKLLLVREIAAPATKSAINESAAAPRTSL
ncbi:MAG: tRNA lysidine(34) synthetase TilS [Bryobacteraceae bacterium]